MSLYLKITSHLRLKATVREKKKKKYPVQLFGVQAPAHSRRRALAKGIPRYSIPYPLIIPLFSTHQMGDIERIAEKARVRKKGDNSNDAMLEMGLRSAVLGLPAKSSSCTGAITGFVEIFKFL
jgi:hypothetical protein